MSLHSRAELSQKNAHANNAAGRPTCAALWLHISSTATALPSEIIAAAVLLNASEDGTDCVGWEVQLSKMIAVDRWIDFGVRLYEMYVKLELLRKHRDNCMQTCDDFPPTVRNSLAEIWEQAINIVANGLHEILALINVDGVYVCPSQKTFDHLWESIDTKSRHSALMATALFNEAKKYMDAARSAQVVGAVQVVEKYTELAVIVVDYITSRLASNTRAGNSQTLQNRTEIFSGNKLSQMHTTVENLEKALEYFKFASKTCISAAASELWRQMYEQHLFVSDCWLRGDTDTDTGPYASRLAVKCILRQIELLSVSYASPLLGEMEQLASQFAISATQPRGRSLHWLNSAQQACERACSQLTTNRIPLSEPETPPLVSIVTRLLCSAMCYEALADTSLTDKDTFEPLVVSAKLLSVTGNGYRFSFDIWGGTLDSICKLDIGVSFVNADVLALLDCTPHAHLVDTLRGSDITTTEPLREQIRLLVELNKVAQCCAAALVVAIRNEDEKGTELWSAVGSELECLDVLVYMQSLHLMDGSSPNAFSKYERQINVFERSRLAALSHDNGDDITSHCYEKANCSYSTACTQRYLDIIDSIVLKVSAADRFLDLIDDDGNQRLDDALLYHSEAADARVAAYIAGQESQAEKQAMLLQVSDLLAGAALKSEAGLVNDAHILKAEADKIRAPLTTLPSS